MNIHDIFIIFFPFIHIHCEYPTYVRYKLKSFSYSPNDDYDATPGVSIEKSLIKKWLRFIHGLLRIDIVKILTYHVFDARIILTFSKKNGNFPVNTQIKYF